MGRTLGFFTILMLLILIIRASSSDDERFTTDKIQFWLNGDREQEQERAGGLSDEADSILMLESGRVAHVPVNVHSFGAVGDGVADDTMAFRNAWDKACSLKNAVLLVPEQHRYKALTIDSSTKIRVKGLTIQFAQQMHFMIYRSDVVRVSGKRILAPKDSPNTDGIHIGLAAKVLLFPFSFQTSAVKISQVIFRNINGTSRTPHAMKFACSDTVPCSNIVLNNINLETETGTAKTFCNCATGFHYGIVQPKADCLNSSSCGGVQEDSQRQTHDPTHTEL
ncbi:hypothetical protein B296_00047296 [Ensete ventricosum]|uniref:Pectate lyase superfamily protein domain-containing protein n=1 Tax=Ensete ventricosum TaxID=4639 RepID=A0A426Y1H3_ENSVE|nr:hypothetical protein B296_00047296 [Ensete ventricosum]